MEQTSLQDDLYERILDEDPAGLRARWERVQRDLEDLARREKQLAADRQRLDAWKAVLAGIAQLRRVDLDQAGSPQAAHSQSDQRPRDAIQVLIDENPAKIWDAESVDHALQDRKVLTSRNNIRMILQRLHNDGAAVRVGHGRYQSAAALADEAVSEQGGEGT